MKKAILLVLFILMTAFTAMAGDLKVSIAVVADDEKTADTIENYLSSELNAIEGVAVSDEGSWVIKIMVTEGLTEENSPKYTLSAVITAAAKCLGSEGDFNKVASTQCERFENFGVFAGPKAELENMCKELIEDFKEGSLDLQN
ncbi:MAG: hypothetical protein KIS76_14890 [Pyrinomonadaceae bacterium]|nr:hypothetical protein [Pyrinomonadaceae bacterium]